MIRVYVASKSVHAPAWIMWSKVWADEGLPVRVVSTWIYEAGPGESVLPDLWMRCITEAASCDVLIAYHGPGEAWKGAFIEIGAALAAGADVIVVGDPPGSWKHHPRVHQVGVGCDVGCAMVDYLARRR